MRNFLQTLARDERGVTAVEYGILAAVIIGVLVGAGSVFSESLENLWESIASALDTAAGGTEDNG